MRGGCPPLSRAVERATNWNDGVDRGPPTRAPQSTAIGEPIEPVAPAIGTGEYMYRKV